MVSNDLQSRLKELRGNKSIKEVADAIGITAQTAGRYESGQRKPDYEIIKRYAEYYNVSSDYVLGLSDVKTPEITIKKINEIIGLSESAIETLKEINELHPSDIKAFSYIIASPFFDKVLDRVERYLFLSHIRTTKENDQISEYMKSLRESTISYAINHQELTNIVCEFIEQKTNIGISEIADLYLQEARDDLLYIVKGLKNKYKRNLEGDE